MTDDQLLTFNGIDGKIGDYDLPPMSGPDLFAFITGARTLENLAELKVDHARGTEVFGPPAPNPGGAWLARRRAKAFPQIGG